MESLDLGIDLNVGHFEDDWFAIFCFPYLYRYIYFIKVEAEWSVAAF